MQSSTVPRRREGRGRVLVVEDNLDVAEITRSHPDELGYTVVHAADVAAAMTILRRAEPPFDLVFSDIVMPGDLNGLDFALAVRREYGAKIVVLLAPDIAMSLRLLLRRGFPACASRSTCGSFPALAKAIRATRIKVVA